MKEPVTLTVTNPHLLGCGNKVTITRGSWPKWMRVLHLPPWARKAMQWPCYKAGWKWGEWSEVKTITSVVGTSVVVTDATTEND